MSVGWEVRGERSSPRPITYWPVYVCPHVHIQTCAFNARQSLHASMYSRKQICKWWLCDFFFAVIERINILHSIGGNVILPGRKRQPGNINCYLLQPESMKEENQPLFFIEIIVPLNYSSYIAVSAYIRTCFCKDFPAPLLSVYQVRITHVH